MSRSIVGFLVGVLTLTILFGCKQEEKKIDPDAAKKEMRKLEEERKKEPWPK